MLGSVYYIYLLVLSCEDPPAIDVLVEDSEENPFYEAVFNQSGSSELVLGGIPTTLHATIVHKQYSMEVEVHTCRSSFPISLNLPLPLPLSPLPPSEHVC